MSFLVRKNKQALFYSPFVLLKHSLNERIYPLFWFEGLGVDANWFQVLICC
jgi:hypothetical protein